MLCPAAGYGGRDLVRAGASCEDGVGGGRGAIRSAKGVQVHDVGEYERMLELFAAQGVGEYGCGGPDRGDEEGDGEGVGEENEGKDRLEGWLNVFE